MIEAHTSYLSFFYTCKSLENKIYTKKTRKLRQTVWYYLEGVNSLHSKLPIFHVKSVKIYTGQSFFTQTPSVDKNLRVCKLKFG